MAEIKEECGICGIYLKNSESEISVPAKLYDMMFALKHRGQLSSGISVYNPHHEIYEDILKTEKMVEEIEYLFRTNLGAEKREQFEKALRGTAGIGHLRYSTAGNSKKELAALKEASPMFRAHGRLEKRFSIGLNGNITNYPELAKDMYEEGYKLDTKVDTEIIMHLVSLKLNELGGKNSNGRYIKPEMKEVCRELMKKLDGAYNLEILFADGEMVVLRDPNGFKPLVFGENKNYYAFASESYALEKIGINDFNFVSPGSCIVFDGNGVAISENLSPEMKKSPCQFEWVYFARAESILDGISVDAVRTRLGEELASIEPLRDRINSRDWVVVPVPKTATPAAEAFARMLGIPCSQALTAEAKRGFINDSSERKEIMSRKYGVLPERIRGKKVLLVEDSIVRGETSDIVVRKIIDGGAEEVHLRSTEPPICCPCFYGIDFPTKKELIANQFSLDELCQGIANRTGANSVVYQTFSGLERALGKSSNEFCHACLDGDYPTHFGKVRAEENERNV